MSAEHCSALVKATFVPTEQTDVLTENFDISYRSGCSTHLVSTTNGGNQILKADVFCCYFRHNGSEYGSCAAEKIQELGYTLSGDTAPCMKAKTESSK